MSTSTLEPNIGSIVALNTHPFFKKEDKDLIFISGEPLTLSPLMIVVETITESKPIYDENSGMQLSKPGSFQCKCIWYSHKSSSFEEVWLSSRLLKVIELYVPVGETKTPIYGSSVIFKTALLEQSKKKISLKQNNTWIEDKNKSITGLLSFTSPVMQVIGTARSDSKEPFVDPKTGKVKRHISKQLIKCKYHNPTSDKFSEVLIPIEALIVVNETSQHYIDNISEYISEGKCLKVKLHNSVFTQTIVKPYSINYKLGNHYLEAKDYLTNKTIEIPIEASEEQFTVIEQEFEHLPRFETSGRRLTILQIKKDTLPEVPTTKFWRIKYKDNNDNVTTRTIYKPEFYYYNSGEVDNEGNNITIDYIKAICLLRNNAERFFRIDRIQLLEVLDLVVSETIRQTNTEMTSLGEVVS